SLAVPLSPRCGAVKACCGTSAADLLERAPGTACEPRADHESVLFPAAQWAAVLMWSRPHGGLRKSSLWALAGLSRVCASFARPPRSMHRRNHKLWSDCKIRSPCDAILDSAQHCLDALRVEAGAAGTSGSCPAEARPCRAWSAPEERPRQSRHAAQCRRVF